MRNPRSYHHGDLQAALIAAALILLEKRGAESLSLRDVAKTTGVSHNAPYRHFSSKRELLETLAQKGFSDLQTAVNQATSAARMTTTEQLIAAGEAYVQQAIHHPEMMRLMFGGLLEMGSASTTLRNAAELAYQSLSSIIQKGIEDGSFKQQDWQILTTSAWSTMHGLAMLCIAGQFGFNKYDEQQKQQLVNQVATTLIHGIKK